MANQLSPWTPLQPQSGYSGVDALIVSYMGRKEIDVLAGAESPYRLQAIVALFQRFAREDQACLDMGFQEGAVAAFRNSGYSLWRVPVVPVVALGRPLEADDLHGLSIVRYEQEGLLGYALHVQGYFDDFNRETRWGLQVRSLKGVVEMHKSLARNNWGISAAGSLIPGIEEVYDRITGFPPLSEAARELGIRRKDERYPFVARILTGADPVLRLVGEVPQIEQPLPETPLK